MRAAFLAPSALFFPHSSTPLFRPCRTSPPKCNQSNPDTTPTSVPTPAAASLSSSSSTSSAPVPSLYEVLGLPPPSDPATVTPAVLRKAYIQQAKEHHPDVAPDQSPSSLFDAITNAYDVLSDPTLRRIYDESGEAGLRAVQSIDTRSRQVLERFGDMSGDQLDFMSDSGQLVGTLLAASPIVDDISTISAASAIDPAGETAPPQPSSSEQHDDACPRSVDEALWNLRHSPDKTVRYYTLWWVYRFKVVEAVPCLIDLLRSSPHTALRRRAALALGAVSRPPTRDDSAVLVALEEAFHTDDFFLRYRIAEAIANIAYRSIDYTRPDATRSNSDKGEDEIGCQYFPPQVLATMLTTLSEGCDAMRKRRDWEDGINSQESLFNLHNVDAATRAKLEQIFAQRRDNESRSRRTTMTPQLGVSRVGADTNDQPFEWILKAASGICAATGDKTSMDTDVIDAFTESDIPLVRYAANKALYSLTGERKYANAIIEALDYGKEHHYSQRVLIRDLGDVGFWEGAEAVAKCPMVENSFKILALKNMLGKLAFDAERPEVRQVLKHMDSLL